ncbi:MAG TPA: DNA alkylation repair protein, partial [Bacteroidota bacterium]|nr:DNA alkylation repair protein [Bacteroidota bacterium]
MANRHSSALTTILAEFEIQKNPANALGMARFGISGANTYGISMPIVRGIAKLHRNDHALALELWETGIHEARILASLVDDPRAVTKKQMKAWAQDFDSWDIVDGCCNNLFVRTPFAHEMALKWSINKREYIRRAGFVLMAVCAVHDKGAPNEVFAGYCVQIIDGSTDERNFVKKAVNWALRQIGKRNETL